MTARAIMVTVGERMGLVVSRPMMMSTPIIRLANCEALDSCGDVEAIKAFCKSGGLAIFAFDRLITPEQIAATTISLPGFREHMEAFEVARRDAADEPVRSFIRSLFDTIYPQREGQQVTS